MKKDQVYRFEIGRPLTTARRKAVEKQIELNAEQSTQPVAYHWQDDDPSRLNISVGPVDLDVRFGDAEVEVRVSAPLWARLLIKEEQENELKGLVATILDKAKFVGPLKAPRAKKKAAVD